MKLRTMELRSMVAEERLALADQLDGLTPEQWNTQSLAAGWTVRHVVAHVIMPFRYSRAQLAWKFLLERGDFNRMADRVARNDATLSTSELAATLRRNADHRFRPPGAGFEAPLTDLCVHGLDICRPLGLNRSRPATTTRVILDALVTPQSLKFFGLDLEGLGLEATDVAWTTGSGMAVSGTADDLILTLGGRCAGAEGLDGEGARILADQLEGPR